MNLKTLLFFPLFFITYLLHPQTDPTLLLHKGDRKNPEGLSNEYVQIPLYVIEQDGVKVPIYLNYNVNGEKSVSLPSSTGYGWELNYGGKIEKEIRHLPDELIGKGWFFNDAGNYVQLGLTEMQANQYNNIDMSPDIFHLKLSSGKKLDFFMQKDSNLELEKTVIENQGNFVSVDLDYLQLSRYDVNVPQATFYREDDDYDIVAMDNNAKYLFRKGVKRRFPYVLSKKPTTYIDTFAVSNYYLHEINLSPKHPNSNIKFDYIETRVDKLIPFVLAGKKRKNSEPQTPPSPADPILNWGYENDISVEDFSRKEIKTITARKSIIKFHYKKVPLAYDVHENTSSSPFPVQEINLLEEIRIYDHNMNPIKTYEFIYTTQTPSQSNYEGAYRIKYILEYGTNNKSYKVYKKFNYFNQPYHDPLTAAKDVLGYFNNELSNDIDPEVYPYMRTYTSFSIFDNVTSADRSPSLEAIKQGMLKSVVDEKGGKKKLYYKLNMYEGLYYGGVLLNKYELYDSNESLISKINYTYEEAEGYGLPISDQDYYNATGSIPLPYEYGYKENFVDNSQTYFTNAYINENHYTDIAYDISDKPFALYENLSTETSSLMQALQLEQHKKGNYYRKVTEKKINVNSNQNETGYKVINYEASVNGLTLSKKVKSYQYFDSEDNKVREISYNYERYKESEFNFINWDLSMSTGNENNYLAQSIRYSNIIERLKSKEIKFYDGYGNIIKTKKDEFEYLNPNHFTPNYQGVSDFILGMNNFPKKITKYQNGIMKSMQSNKYLVEFSNARSIHHLYYYNPLIEKSIWISSHGLKLKSSITRELNYKGQLVKTYIADRSFNNKPIGFTSFEPAYYDSQSYNLVTMGRLLQEFKYNENGDLINIYNHENKLSRSFIRSSDLDGRYVDVVLDYRCNISELPYLKFSRKSFEDKSEANVERFKNAFSGNYVFTGESLNLGFYPDGYEIIFYEFKDSKWHINRTIHNGGLVTITRGENVQFIDEVRIKPRYSQMTSKTIKPLVGVTSSLDNKIQGERIEYDLFGRKLFIKDENGNILSEFRYNNILTIDDPLY